MSEPKYKKGDKVWTVNGEGGIVYGVKLNSNNFRDRWYSVTLTAPNLRFICSSWSLCLLS